MPFESRLAVLKLCVKSNEAFRIMEQSFSNDGSLHPKPDPDRLQVLY